MYDIAPFTGDTEYGTFFCFLQTNEGPVIDEGICGRPVTDMQEGLLVPQLLPVTTQRFPEENDAPKLTVTEFVPCPVAMDAPAGAVQVYVTAPGTIAVE